MITNKKKSFDIYKFYFVIVCQNKHHH